VTEFLLYLYAESPVHTGAADSADVLDLPVQREASTGYPVIWGQSLKGALRQAARDVNWPRDQVNAVFGSDIEDLGPDRQTTPGVLAVGDAQLVAMPVPTLRRTFAWLTSDIALGRLARKYSQVGRDPLPVPQVAPDTGRAADGAWTASASEVLGSCLVRLGDERDEQLAAWAELLARDALGDAAGFVPFAAKIRGDLIMAGSEVAPILLRECTEQAVRVQLARDSKTVQNGPFYSEYLPAETILAAALTLRGTGDTEDNQADLRHLLHGQLLRIGGDETLGKGLMWGRLLVQERPA